MPFRPARGLKKIILGGTVGAPKHVAIIMDGNGRWATGKGWPRLVGHRKGVERVREVVRTSPDLGIEWLTLYAFSTENWTRSTEEVIGLMTLFASTIKREAKDLDREGVRVRFIGDRGKFEPRLRRLMDWIENLTRDNTRFNLTLALNYGGRNEITRAVRVLALQVAEAGLDPDAIEDAHVSAALDTQSIPDPDLVIRTSGEMRVSNFLLWQSAYAEFEFSPVLWPDFTAQNLADIVARFSQRDRRFGSVQK